jgi:hypothetical protein
VAAAQAEGGMKPLNLIQQPARGLGQATDLELKKANIHKPITNELHFIQLATYSMWWESQREGNH